MAAKLLGIPMSEVGSVKPDLARRRRPHARDDAGEARLPRSARTDHTHDLTGQRFKGDMMQGGVRMLRRARREGDKPQMSERPPQSELQVTFSPHHRQTEPTVPSISPTRHHPP